MKYLTIFLLSFLLSSFNISKKESKTPYELGQKIFEIIKQGDKQASLKKLIVTKKQLIEVLDKSGQSGEEFERFKKEFTTEFDARKKRELSEILESYNNIKDRIEKVQCRKNLTIGTITPKTQKLRNIPFELGELNIEIKCNTTDTLNVHIINTLDGWRILEKLRMH